MRKIRYARLPTERPNPASRRIDRLTPLAIARLMNRADQGAEHGQDDSHGQDDDETDD